VFVVLVNSVSTIKF